MNQFVRNFDVPWYGLDPAILRIRPERMLPALALEGAAVLA
jgi:hypothetical protein